MDGSQKISSPEFLLRLQSYVSCRITTIHFLSLTNGSTTQAPKAVAPVRAVTEAKVKVAINGFGRIGRNFLRCWHGREDSPLEVVAINDTGGVKQVIKGFFLVCFVAVLILSLNRLPTCSNTIPFLEPLMQK